MQSENKKLVIHEILKYNLQVSVVNFLVDTTYPNVYPTPLPQPYLYSTPLPIHVCTHNTLVIVRRRAMVA